MKIPRTDDILAISDRMKTESVSVMFL